VASPLKTERIRRGLTADELARAVDVKGPTISRIENGRTRPSPELTIRISEFFDEALTRDQILFPEFYQPGRKKPVRRAQLQEAS
jgi:transcriptional regulator with XRE-family HTH domain